jgi:hypothetical protein
LKSGVGFSDIEKGISTLAGSGDLICEVNKRNINITANVSTIGVMSIRGDLVGNLIFGITVIHYMIKPKDKFKIKHF